MSRAGKPSLKSLVLDYLETNRPALVDQQELAALHRHVAERVGAGKRVSDRYLLEVVSETDTAVDRALGGLPLDLRGRVHFRDAASAEASLLDLEREYGAAREAGDRPRAEDCRRAVRQAKDRLRMILRNPRLSAAKKAEKEELLRWFLVWLEDPLLFSHWLALRKRALAQHS